MNLLKREIANAAMVEIEWPNGDREPVYFTTNALTVPVENDAELAALLAIIGDVKRLN